MTDAWSYDIEELRSRLSGFIERVGLEGDSRELASEALEELAVVIEEMQSQNAELLAGREQLDHERHRYRALFDSVPDGYLITDMAGMISEANATVCELLGQPRDKIVGKPLSIFIEQPDQRAFYTHLNRIGHAQPGEQLSIDLLVHDHGTIPATLLVAVSDTDNETETSLRWLIHDRRPELATEQLRTSEERLRALFDTALVGIMLCDSEGQIIFVNQQADKILGRRIGDTTLDGWIRTVHADDQPKLRHIVDAAATQGKAAALRHRVVDSSGAARWVDHSIVAFRDHDKTINGFVSTLTDITAETTATTGLQESRDFTTAIVDTVGAIIVVLDATGHIQRFNRASETISGFSADEVVGQSMIETLVPPQQRERVNQALTTASSQSPVTSEHDWMTANGNRRNIVWTYTTLERDDATTFIVCTGIDITDQRLLESRLAQADRLESIGLLAAGIAHDFNNTLATLHMRLERLDQRIVDPDSQTDIAAASATIDRTQTLIADLLSFSSRQELSPTAIDLNAELERITGLLSELLGKHITIELDLTRSADTIALIDPTRFDQIITNLAINARDAMPEGGTLTIATTADTIPSEPPPAADITGQLNPGTYVKISVTDTGSGITPEHKPLVFDPYFTTKPAGRGTGLGLATTYGTLSQTGGTITVESEPTKGTTFTLWIPHSNLDNATQSIQPEPGDHRRRPATVGQHTEHQVVLVVEDDPDMNQALLEHLQSLNYQTIEAATGEQALTHLATPIDLLLTDVQLPDIDGTDIAATFTKHSPNLRVLFISGAAPNELQQLLPKDAQLLKKPFTLQQLTEALHTR